MYFIETSLESEKSYKNCNLGRHETTKTRRKNWIFYRSASKIDFSLEKLRDEKKEEERSTRQRLQQNKNQNEKNRREREKPEDEKSGRLKLRVFLLLKQKSLIFLSIYFSIDSLTPCSSSLCFSLSILEQWTHKPLTLENLGKAFPSWSSLVVLFSCRWSALFSSFWEEKVSNEKKERERVTDKYQEFTV